MLPALTQSIKQFTAFQLQPSDALIAKRLKEARTALEQQKTNEKKKYAKMFA